MWFTVVIKFVKGFFLGGVRDYLPLLLAITCIGGIGWKIYNTIGDYKDEIASLNKKVLDTEDKVKDITKEKDEVLKELGATQILLTTKENELLRLQISVNKQNESISNLKANEALLIEEVEKWKHQPPKEVIKYVEKKLKAKDLKKLTLEACEKLNKNISNLDYRELK